MSEIHVVDAEGNSLKKPPTNKPSIPRPLPITREQRPVNPVAKTLADLEKLEDGIWNHTIIKDPGHQLYNRNFRAEYLKIYSKQAPSSSNFEDYLARHNEKKKKALLYCLNKLRWTPLESGEGVFIASKENKYRKYG